MKNRSLQAFTLAELLVSLSVLGLVAAFAIPKVLISVADQSAKAAGREAFAMINDAFMAYKAENFGIVGNGTTSQSLVNYMNFKQQLTGASTPTIGEAFTPVSGVTSPTSGVQLLNGLTLGYLATDTMAANAVSNNRGTLGFVIDADAKGAFAPVTVFVGSDGRAFAPYDYIDGGTSLISYANANLSGNNGYDITTDTLGMKAAANCLYPGSASTGWWIS